MDALGRHLLVEYYGCDTNALDNIELLEKSMQEAVRRSGATIINSTFHQFNPHGVSGVIVIAESHMAIHTWPEYRYAAVDFFTCGSQVDPWKAFHFLNKIIKSEKSTTRELKRGLLELTSQRLMLDITY